jgi:quercetin dioxygenase-like cupin family protein
MDRDTFESELRAAGYTDIVARDMEAGKFNPEHTHEFDARGLITAGEFVLTCGGQPRTYRSGDVFDMAAGTPHTEQCGPAGASYIAGRRFK